MKSGTIRKLKREDVPVLETIVRETGVFTEDEVAVAVELMNIFLNHPSQRDYDVRVSVGHDGAVQGYVCVGPTPMTDGTYDLHWIAVDPKRHGRGIGKELQKFTEDLVLSQGGRLVIAETSGQTKYENTRKFYIALGYTEVARIENFYRTGDDKVVYGKYLSQLQGAQ